MIDQVNRKVITWKDADRILCQMAAYMLHNASVQFRGVKPGKDYSTTDPGLPAKAGMGEENAKTTFWTYEEPVFPFDDYTDTNQNVTVTCWYSFQNLVRLRLKEARKELEKALYTQERRKRGSAQLSRNPKGRLTRSRFGRQPEA